MAFTEYLYYNCQNYLSGVLPKPTWNNAYNMGIHCAQSMDLLCHSQYNIYEFNDLYSIRKIYMKLNTP